MDKQKAILVDVMECQRTEKLNPVIKEVLKMEDELAPHTLDEDKESHTWKAETKYYSADIDLTILKKKSIMDEKFSANAEAVLLYFDSRVDCDGLGKMKSWMPFIEMWEPSIKLAVCEKCDRDQNTTISRVAAQEWCLEHDFELVELKPDLEDYDEYEDTGIKRIRNALLAHMWPNMDMKNPQNAVKKPPKSCVLDAASASAPEDPQSRIDQLLGKEGEFDDVIGDENEQDDFEKLFSKLQVMKDQASSLDGEERKKFAENMVKAFWTALGGEGEELEGLSSDEEDDNKTSDPQNVT